MTAPARTLPAPADLAPADLAPADLAAADLAPAPGDLDEQAVVTIRMLAADAVQAAGSGHPGLPMGAAAAAYVLWSRFLRHDPACPTWPDRDRFVLSAGHGSMLLYALLHLFGYGLRLDELASFRRWGSRTPGHPEHGHTPGVALRAIPGLAVIRPADANETSQAWDLALSRTSGPTALILSRQELPVLPPPPAGFLAQARARVLQDGGTQPKVTLAASGSEVSLALAAADQLRASNIAARVVSIPWRERLLASGSLDTILPPGIPRVIIEAGSPDCWQALAGPGGDVIGVHTFGASAPGPVVMTRLGLTSQAICAAAHNAILAAAGKDSNDRI